MTCFPNLIVYHEESIVVVLAFIDNNRIVLLIETLHIQLLLLVKVSCVDRCKIQKDVVDSISFQQILFQNCRSPLSELDATFRVDFVSNRDDHVKVEIVNIHRHPAIQRWQWQSELAGEDGKADVIVKFF